MSTFDITVKIPLVFMYVYMYIHIIGHCDYKLCIYYNILGLVVPPLALAGAGECCSAEPSLPAGEGDGAAAVPLRPGAPRGLHHPHCAA